MVYDTFEIEKKTFTKNKKNHISSATLNVFSKTNQTNKQTKN